MSRRSTLLALAGLTLMALFPVQVSSQQSQLVVIELNTRTADEVIPLLNPMLARGGTIGGLKDKLIIRTTPANLAELRKILDIVDGRPRSLLITVRQDRGSAGDDRELEVSGSIGNDRVRVVVPGAPASTANDSDAQTQAAGNSVHVRANSRRSDASRRTLQTVRVLEGNTAFIGIGESIPLRERSIDGGAVTHETIGFQEAVSGFYAKPRINGNRVTVQLSAAADTILDRESGVARIQRVTSVVSGRAGEWIEVGGIAERADERQADIASRRSRDSRDQRRIYIMVEETK
jgi:hypothetical protein